LTRKTAARLVEVIAGITLAIVATTAWLVVTNLGTIHSLEEANPIEVVLPLSFVVVGGLIASRLPRNPLGWLLLSNALAEALVGVTQQYARYGTLVHPGAPFVAWAAWLGNWVNGLIYPAGMACIALLLIPDGRFLSPRWRSVAWFALTVTALVLVVTILDPSPIEFNGLPPIANPVGLSALGGVLDWVGFGGYLLGLVILLLAAASVVIRMRRATGDTRLQLKWVTYAVAVSVVANVAMLPLGLIFSQFMDRNPWLPTIVTVLGFGVALPASFGFAILRYRLYDIDLIVNRTVVYGAVTVILATVFFVADLALTALTGQRSDLISGALGFGTALALGPVRRRVRPVVDRLLPGRARLTLLFTDIVGSTQAIVDLGDERWRALLGRYRALVRRELTRFGGREINTAGDAFFATFSRPMAGLRCALAIRPALRQLGLETRTGLHVGEVEMRGEEVSGLAVHTAARVMAEGGAGEILVSNALREALSGQELALHDRGRHELKGVPGEWQLFAVDTAGGID
jgi:class 3 adenylate cyclase